MARRTELADKIDKHVGARIQSLRVSFGLSQSDVARLIGVSYQQAHKYERGTNRISAGRLAMLARALGVPAAYFFEGTDAVHGHGFEGLAEPHAAPPVPANGDTRLLLELGKHFKMIPSHHHREAVYQLVRALSE